MSDEIEVSEAEVTPDQLREAKERSRADASSGGVAAGLEDARATLAEIWRRHDDPALRRRAMRALQAVISAEQTMQAADAFLTAQTKREQQAAFDKLKVACCLRIGHDVRRKP